MHALRRIFDWCDQRRRAIWVLVILLIVSFAGKVALRLLVLPDPDYWESGYSFYFGMAQNYLRTGSLCFGDPDSAGAYYAFRPPLYPLFIAAVCRLTDDSAAAFVVCQALVSTATVGLVYVMTARLARPAAAVTASALYAFYPYAFYHDTQLQENVLYNALSFGAAAAFMAALSRRRGRWFFLAGLLSGTAVLTRMSHMAVILFLLGGLGIAWRRQPRQALCMGLAFVLGVLLLTGPWMIRNQCVTGHFALTSETGFALARAHNDYTFRYYPYRDSIDVSWEAYHDNMDEETRLALDQVAANEFACSRWYAGQAVAYIRSHPGETVVHGLYKVAVNFLGVLSPSHGWFKNWSYSISCWLVTLLALRGLLTLRGAPFVTVLVAMVLAQVTVSFVFWAHTSHRSFLDPLFAVAAGVGLVSLVSSSETVEEGDRPLPQYSEDDGSNSA
jgi:4-amino-4-deoxy-L-arabinose transferase-like glycosyltransferase